MHGSAEIAEKYLDRMVVRPGSPISLKKDFDPGMGKGRLDSDDAQALLAQSIESLSRLQDMLYAQDRYALLIIFQAMDAAGKDGTIKHVLSGVNPQGCEVTSFKAPSPEELDHGYLWRCMRRLPARGMIGIFNRSYYEEVLVVRVHPDFLTRQRIPDKEKNKKIWSHRFSDINNFERYLTRNGTIVLKFFLHVSRKEQKRRFLERLENPDKNWKFSESDVRERRLWRDYMAAYEECLQNTSTKYAPWYVIPADDKPFMRVLVSGVIARALESLELGYPELSGEQKGALSRAKRFLKREK